MRFLRIEYAIGFILLIAFALSPANPLFAQTAQQSVDARRAQLEQDLAAIEAKIAEQQVLLDGKQKERVSLERDLGILDAGIKKAKLDIQARTLVITRLTQDIHGKESTIGELNEKLVREKQSLAQLIRRTNEIDEFSLVEVVLSNRNLSSFFEDLDSFSSIKVALGDSFDVIDSTKISTQEQKEALEDRRSEEQELRQLQELQKQRIEEQEKEKNNILKITKGVESAYQSLIATQQKTAAQIRAELFQLRGSAAIPFGEALDYANFASAKTGVRAAVILGILAEESNLGENVGTGTWTVDMHPTRDRPVFSYITAELGLSADVMPVSKKAWYGWGGAMGPAQFIPSTWVCYGGFVNSKTGDCGNSARSISMDAFWQGPWEYRAEKDRLRKLLGGSSVSNPWDPKTAIMATAVLMMDNGADKGGAAAERLAALRYLAGWSNATKPAYAFYGDDVMKLAAKYQSMIDALN